MLAVHRIWHIALRTNEYSMIQICFLRSVIHTIKVVLPEAERSGRTGSRAHGSGLRFSSLVDEETLDWHSADGHFRSGFRFFAVRAIVPSLLRIHDLLERVLRWR